MSNAVVRTTQALWHIRRPSHHGLAKKALLSCDPNPVPLRPRHIGIAMGLSARTLPLEQHDLCIKLKLDGLDCQMCRCTGHLTHARMSVASEALCLLAWRRVFLHQALAPAIVGQVCQNLCMASYESCKQACYSAKRTRYWASQGKWPHQTSSVPPDVATQIMLGEIFGRAFALAR